MLGWEEDIDPCDYQGQDVPDLALDPDECTLSICNIHATTRVCYVTVYEAVVRDKHGNVLEAGSTTDNAGKTRSCATFIVLCPPHTFAHLCYLDVPEEKSILDIQVDSDVQDWNQHPASKDTHQQLLAFPLGPTGSQFLCTQGEGGELTHFFSGNLHAIDFRCDIGTPVLAVADGVVVDVQDDNTLTGVAVSNLFQWNSILLQIDTEGNDHEMTHSHHQETVKGGPLYVEYVHIEAKSAKVQKGDRVTRGQVICCSGSVGFSPEPHLHFAAYRSRSPTAPTVRVKFCSEQGKTVFLPKAGVCYDENGSVETTT